MSDSAKTVLWLGIIMIAVGIILRWSEISAVIFGSSSKGDGTTNVKKGTVAGPLRNIVPVLGHGYHGA
jgi:hypothetical protein